MARRGLGGLGGTALVVLAMLAGLTATVYGLAQQEWPSVLPFSRPGGTMAYLVFIAACTLAIALVQVVFRVSCFASTAFLGVAVALVCGGLAALASALFFMAASWSLGYFALKTLCPEGPPACELTRALVGAGLWSTVVSLTAHFEVNTSWAYTLTLVLPILAARNRLPKLVQTFARQVWQRSLDLRHLVERSLLGALVLTYAAFAFLPELAHDPLAVHLFVPGYIEANHAWTFDPAQYAWTLMPMLADWSYTIAYLLGGEASAKLINLAFLLACAQLARQLVQTLGGGERGANWGALLLLSTPLTLLLGSALYTEPFWSAYLLAGSLCAFRILFGQGDQQSQLISAALLLAFSAAAKAVALVILPIVFALLVPRVTALLAKEKLRTTAKAAGLFLALGAIPYMIAWLVSGNPVFPFFNGIFESPFYPAENFNNRSFNADLGWHLPYELVFFAERFTSGMTGTVGAAGFQWLLLLAPALTAALAFRDRKSLVLGAVCLSSLLAVFVFQSHLRYVFPAYVLLSALVGLAISNAAGAGWVVRGGMLGLGLLTLGLNVLFFGSCSPNYRDLPLLAVFDPEVRERLVLRRAPIRNAVELVNQLNESGAPVIFLSQPLAAGLNSEALFANWYNRTFRDDLRAAGNADAFNSLMRSTGARYLISDAAWRGRRERTSALVDQAFHRVAGFGSLSVLKLDDALFFSEELLTGPSELLSSAWTLRAGFEAQEDGSVIVTEESPVTQAVPVEPGGIYLNRVTARCAGQPARGRLQVNWRDAGGELLDVEIKAFDCAPHWVTQGQEVVAPLGAVRAVVFGSSHSAKPIQISRVSFRSNVSAPYSAELVGRTWK